MFVTGFGIFLEEEFLSKENSGSMVTLEEIRDPLPETSGQTEVQQAPSRALEQVQQVPEVSKIKESGSCT